VTDSAERPQHIGWHDKRATLIERMQVVGGQRILWRAAMAAEFAPRLLPALLRREFAPLRIGIR
jgi:hypothetical protein